MADDERRAEIEAVVRAEAERLGYRPGEFMDDHMAIALAVLEMGAAHGLPPIEEDAAYWRQKYEEALHAADPPKICQGVERILLDDGREFVLDSTAHGYDREPATTFQDALAAACGTVADPPARSSQGEHGRVLVNDERTVLVNIWSTGEVEVAFRDGPGAMWGPPIRVVGDA